MIGKPNNRQGSRAQAPDDQSNPGPTRVAAYVRVSSLEQVDTWSLDSQKRAIHEYCDRNAGFTIVETYVDGGHSAWKGNSEKRPEYRRMMSDAQAGKFDMVITTTIDRMSRSLFNMLETVETLSKAKVAYKSLAEDFDFGGPQGEFFLSMMASFAQLYSSQLSAHVRRSLEQRVRAGLSIGRPPYGYQLCDDGCAGAEGKHAYFHANEEKGAKVVEIFERYASGTYSFEDLAKLMNEEGYRTNGTSSDRRGDDHSGHRFLGTSISKILRNPIYAGQITFNGRLYPGIHEPLIGEELFQRVQVVMEKNVGHYKFDGRRSRGGHLLAKVARCHECGHRLTASRQGTQNDNTYYVMAKKAKGSECHYAGRSFEGSAVDDIMDRLFRDFELRDDWKEYVVTKFIQDTRVDELARRRATLLRNKDRVNELYFEGEIERDERDARVSVINEALTATEVLPDYAVEKAGELLEEFKDLWTSASRQEQNDLVRTVLDAVYIDCEQREIVAIQPNRAFAGPLRAMAERSDLALLEASELHSVSRELSPYGLERRRRSPGR